ncbi:hypothetical protein H0I25_00615 [Cellulophaga sp. HaHa_2_95]|nr:MULTISPECIES: hypothetical protein [unclassified Cellulophaga]QXP51347.1 hypothetical protein H0I24_14505 [Cellulophaga sp. HaHa_2_1]QXP56327.1 hypothetical protein H0I25_00615 [Cellulophaga sp. HaHa_2_95]
MNQNNYKYQTNSRVGNIRSAIGTTIESLNDYILHNTGNSVVDQNIEQTD